MRGWEGSVMAFVGLRNGNSAPGRPWGLLPVARPSAAKPRSVGWPHAFRWAPTALGSPGVFLATAQF